MTRWVTWGTGQDSTLSPGSCAPQQAEWLRRQDPSYIKWQQQCKKATSHLRSWGPSWAPHRNSITLTPSWQVLLISSKTPERKGRHPESQPRTSKVPSLPGTELKEPGGSAKISYCDSDRRAWSTLLFYTHSSWLCSLLGACLINTSLPLPSRRQTRGHTQCQALFLSFKMSLLFGSHPTPIPHVHLCDSISTEEGVEWEGIHWPDLKAPLLQRAEKQWQEVEAVLP